MNLLRTVNFIIPSFNNIFKMRSLKDNLNCSLLTTRDSHRTVLTSFAIIR